MKSRRAAAAVAMGIWILQTFPASTDAADPAVPTEKTDVRQVLLAELKAGSETIDRRDLLQPDAHLQNSSKAAWWQAGYVKTDKGWKPVEKSHWNIEGELVNEYRRRRDAALPTAEGQLKLANWCQSQKLADAERAHLLQVPSLSEAGIDPGSMYARMGYKQIGPQWFSPSEYQSATTAFKKDEEHRRRWSPKIERIVQNWAGNPKQRKQSLADLSAIEDRTAITCLAAASEFDESLAVAICGQLGRIPAFEASQALATLAVTSESPNVRRTSAELLKGRRLDDFAPSLLAVMRSPYELVKAGQDAAERRLVFREENDRHLVIDLQIVPICSITQPMFIYGLTTGRLRVAEQFPVSSRLQNDGVRALADFDNAIQQRLDVENDLTEQYNDRSAAVLAEVTGQQPSNDPRYWWAWWHIYSATEALPKKYEIHHEKKVLPMIVVKHIPLQIIASCLVAGTPVWTECGFVAIEQIQIGDRVLSKDIETGEVDYKPVLRTTVRRPVPVKRFLVAGESITASDGHHFWSSGAGWKKTRELSPSLPIHTVTGVSRVESIKNEDKPEAVYNLAVADFHTYFVGKPMVLSHDVTPPSPTNFKVPGLDPDQH